jgi:hypothetical protein
LAEFRLADYRAAHRGGLVRRFLELYQESRSPTFLAHDFRRVIGSEAVDALLASAVLTHRKLADWYPCHGSYPGCPRRIVPNIGDRLHPFVAICGETRPMCHEIVVRAEDLEEYTTSHEAFAGVVRRLLGLAGELTLLDDSYPDCVYLGDLPCDEHTYDIFLCRAAWDSAFDALLADRLPASRRSIVFAPTPRGLPVDLLHRYAPGGHVTLALLVDFMALHEGKLILRPSFDSLTKHPRATTGTSWTLITHEGRRAIDSTEYADLAAHAETFDLFLDAVSPGHSRAYSAGYRDKDGAFHRATLSAVQMHALTELVSRAVPMRATELRSLQAAAVQNPAKVIDAARRAVDVRLSRYGWRSFHTLAGESSDQKRYVFRPPAALRYACIVGGPATRSPKAESS